MTSMTMMVCHIGIFLPIIKSSYTYKFGIIAYMRLCTMPSYVTRAPFAITQAGKPA